MSAVIQCRECCLWMQQWESWLHSGVMRWRLGAHRLLLDRILSVVPVEKNGQLLEGRGRGVDRGGKEETTQRNVTKKVLS